MEHTKQAGRFSSRLMRGVWALTLVLAFLLSSAAFLEAAPVALSGNAKKAVKPLAIKRTSKTAVARRAASRESVLVKNDGKEKKTRQAAAEKHGKAGSGKACLAAKKSPARKKQSARMTQETKQLAQKPSQRSMPQNTSGALKADQAQLPSPETPALAQTADSKNTPFAKRRASLDKETQLANTLQNRLGVEVMAPKDGSSHRGGLFIAPPPDMGNTDHEAKIMEFFAGLPLGWPIDEKAAQVSSSFGGRRDPLNRRKAFHEGMDFRAKTGTQVRATGNGKVVYSGYSPDYGENVIVSHGKGYETVFAHLSRRLVQVGDVIEPGDLVGLVGNSGRSTGSHLHYEIRYQGAPINPADYLRAGQQARMRKK